MLSLTSSSTPRLTATRSLVKVVTRWGSPSSNTSKSSCVRPVTRRPLLSTTVTVTGTVRTLERNTCATDRAAGTASNSTQATVKQPR